MSIRDRSEASSGFSSSSLLFLLTIHTDPFTSLSFAPNERKRLPLNPLKGCSSVSLCDIREIKLAYWPNEKGHTIFFSYLFDRVVNIQVPSTRKSDAISKEMKEQR